jgi:hypothetical protein
MPRLNVIVLSQTLEDLNTYNVALWADVPVARQTFYANPNAKSAWDGATTTDNTNLQNGSVIERVITQRLTPGTSRAQFEAFLQTAWQNFQNQVTNVNPWSVYGSNWDGTTWTLVTVA